MGYVFRMNAGLRTRACLSARGDVLESRLQAVILSIAFTVRVCFAGGYDDIEAGFPRRLHGKA